MAPKTRRNFFPTFIINVLFWLAWFYVILVIPPERSFTFSLLNFTLTFPLGFFLFFFTLFLSASLTFAFMLSSTRRGFLLSLFISGLLLLRLIKQVYILNLILLGGTLTCLELYFSRQNTRR